MHVGIRRAEGSSSAPTSPCSLISFSIGTSHWTSWWRGSSIWAGRRSARSSLGRSGLGIVLFRVDERLVHGQVTLGWGSQLRPAAYWVVDDDLARTDWEGDLYRLGVPADAQSDFFTVGDGRERLPGWLASPSRYVVLTRDLDHMLRLARGGLLAGKAVNLGGIHHRPGRAEVLPYLFLDGEDRDRVRELQREGVAVWAQDLPGAPEVRGPALVDA
ncbi:MAG: PTS mannose/fructose/sorbose transporter subunit IIB [Gemmatimonadetes bacterium]|nr:PTS mannose/fructose/sorbose transporter subunit IIB [Gemmatimonadota bacterium]